MRFSWASFVLGILVGIFAAGVLSLILHRRHTSKPSPSPDAESTGSELWPRQVIILLATSTLFIISGVSIVLYRRYVLPDLLAAGAKPSLGPDAYSIVIFGIAFLTDLAATAFAFIVSYYWVIRAYREDEIKRQLKKYVVDLILPKLPAPMNEVEDKKRLTECVLDPIRELLPSPGDFEEFGYWKDAPLGSLIRNAKTIDLCVQGWDSMYKTFPNDWKNFFGNGGRLNLIYPNIKITKPAEQTIHHMATRMRWKPQKMQDEITNTVSVFQQVNTSVGNKGFVNLRPIDAMIWYSLIRIDKRYAFISLYESYRVGVQIGSPLYKIDLDKFACTAMWIQKELDGFQKTVETSTNK